MSCTKFYTLEIIKYLICLCVVQMSNAVADNKVTQEEYFVEHFDSHRVHLLVLDSAKYDLQIVSSNNVKADHRGFTRDTVDNITASVDGDIGVNAGFFEIGDNNDGMPSGSLVIDGKFYGMQSKNLPCLIKRQRKFNLNEAKSNEITIEKIQPRLNIVIAGQDIKIDHFNKFIVNKKTYIYNDVWGEFTPESFENRQEIVIDNDGTIIAFNEHSGSAIPKGGYVISLASNNTKTLKSTFKHDIISTKARFEWSPEFIAHPNTSMVMGLPMLIDNGKVISGLNNSAPNARTAFGITKDGHYVIVVVEHFSLSDIKNLSLTDIGEVLQNEEMLLKSSDVSSANKKTSNVDRLKDLLRDKISSKAAIIGLTTHELAKYMLTKGCVKAINLDGGGSSSLYLNGQFVNVAVGDVEEASGIKTHRAVANALVFNKK